ncbi:MAG: glycosyltransferase [Alphaproteobacteria bacterium]|nr:glycosyltransferase [Alphaproteobacteria bacterium]
MRILHIMAGETQGGAETYSTDVMLSLHAQGVDQCVVMSPRAPRFAELQRAGIRMAPRVLAVPFRPLQKLLLRLLIKREKPDIIHCWMRRAASLVPKSLAQSRLRGARETGIPQSSRAPRIIAWFGGYYDPSKFKSCGVFVGVTRDIVAHMVKNGVPAQNAHFIPTFPDVAPMPPVDRATLATQREVKVLLALSRLHPKKGLDTLLQALTRLPDCVAWLAGDGPLRRELENTAKTLGVLDRVRFLGWRTDRAALLRAADVCVLPSRYEPFGTVILEAWAAGTALVACASAGPAAHVQDGVTGLLVPIDDADALARALRRALDDEPLRRALIAQGYAAYIKDYTREAVTRQWMDFYKNGSPDYCVA